MIKCVSLTVVPATHAVTKLLLGQHSLRILNDISSHLVVWRFHAVKNQLSALLLVSLFDCPRMTLWNRSPAMIGQLRFGVTA